VAIYFLAISVRLSPEEAARHIEDSKAETEVEEEELATAH
jgi:hypothetical protein